MIGGRFMPAGQDHPVDKTRSVGIYQGRQLYWHPLTGIILTGKNSAGLFH